MESGVFLYRPKFGYSVLHAKQLVRVACGWRQCMLMAECIRSTGTDAREISDTQGPPGG